MGTKPDEREGPNREAADSPGAARRALETRAGRVLWPFVAFLAISSWAHTGFRFFPSLPPSWQGIMGQPPPPFLINVVFVVYLLSALMLNLMRMADNAPPDPGYRPVLFLGAFYAFHHVSGSLRDNFS